MCHRREEELAILRRIQAAGIPIDPEVKAQLTEFGLKIELLGEIAAARAFDLRFGGTLYVLYPRITCQMAGPVFVHDLELKPPWEDSIDWLDEFSQLGQQASKFQGMFPKHLALDHGALYSKPLRRGGWVEGLLIGRGAERMPNQYGHCSWLPVEFSVIDRSSQSYSTKVEFLIDRSEKAAYETWIRSLQQKVRPRSSLWDPGNMVERQFPALRLHPTEKATGSTLELRVLPKDR